MSSRLSLIERRDALAGEDLSLWSAMDRLHALAVLTMHPDAVKPRRMAFAAKTTVARYFGLV